MVIKNHRCLSIETGWLNIAHHPDVLAVLPPGAILSLPVPAARLQSLCGFYYTRDGSGRVRIVARFCGSLIQQDLFDLRYPENGCDSLFPGLDENHLILPERAPIPDEKYGLFFDTLGTLMLLYAGHEQPCDAGRVYLDSLFDLEPESLIPVYRALSPAFFAWLRDNPCNG